jgi:hypothetical protein
MSALALTAAPAVFSFGLGRVANHPSVTDTEVSVRVTTIGPPPSESILTETGNWTVTVKGPENLRLAVSPSKVAHDPATGVVTLTLSRGPFGTTDPAKCSWQVVFQSPGIRLDALQDPAVSDDFALGSASGSGSGDEIRVRVRASGIPPPGDVVNNPAYWRVQATDSSGNRKAVQPVSRAQYSFNAGSVILTFPAAELGPVKTSDASWSAAFLAPDTTLTTPPGNGSGALQQAKSRDAADLYVSGTYIAGVGTKPIWAIDAKAGYSDAPEKVPVLNWFFKSSPPNLRFGIYGELTTNPDTQPPVDRTQVDPDSIVGYTTLFQTVRLAHNPFFYGLKWEAQPVGGEFSRKYPSSNLISGGRVRLVRVLASEKRWGADLIPSLGFEGGKSLNSPGILFMRPVDLHGYHAIARLRTGADANLYWYRRVPTPDDTYAFTLNGSWVARVPFTAEPFTTTAYLPDLQDATKITRQQVVEVRKNTRHYVHVSAAWNVTKLFGLQAEYKYGALPPLFELVQHQVSIGLLFKATYQKNHGVASPLP